MTTLTAKDKTVLEWVGIILVLNSLFFGGKKLAQTLDQQKRKKFHDLLLPVVEKEATTPYGFQPEPVIVQSSLESSWGESELSRLHNNYFGMTAGDAYLNFLRGSAKIDTVPAWTASGNGREVVFYPTWEESKLRPEQIKYWNFAGDVLDKTWDEKNQKTVLRVRVPFRAYASLTESVRDWARKIATTPRYAGVIPALKSGDVVAYARLISQAGYATDQNYPAKLTQRSGELKEALV